MLSELEGCQVLARVFEQRGYAIALDVPLELAGVRFTADGWDGEARVGFEYLTHEADDHHDLSPEEVARLGELMDRGELFMLLIDEQSIEGADELSWAAHRFLDEVERRKAAR